MEGTHDTSSVINFVPAPPARFESAAGPMHSRTLNHSFVRSLVLSQRSVASLSPERVAPPCCCRPSERVAPRHREPCGALRNIGKDERGRRECNSDSCPRISSGRSIEKIQMGNMAADYKLGLAPAARRIMRQQKSSRAHELRRGARARDGSRYLCTRNSERTTPAGWPTHGRRARRPFFRLQFGPGPALRH
jgi:hypothetical protein